MNKVSTVAWMMIAVLIICVATAVVVLFQKQEFETVTKDSDGKEVLSVAPISKNIFGLKTS